jgi:hypothetical protein
MFAPTIGAPRVSALGTFETCHVDCIEQCPILGVTRKTFARTEFFSV